MKINSLIIVVLILFVSSCRDKFDNKSIAKNFHKNRPEILSIMHEGIESSEKNISSSEITMLEYQTWRPNYFDQSQTLTELLGVRIRSVSFMYFNGIFRGMLMRISDDSLLYVGEPIENVKLGGTQFLLDYQSDELRVFLAR